MRNARAQECVGRRALVTHDDGGEGEGDGGVGGAHSWWACVLVTTGMSRQPALVATSLGAAAAVVAEEHCSLLLTPHQACRLGARSVTPFLDRDLPVPSGGEEELACPMDGPLSGASAVLFSREYVYELATLATRADRSFRKKCRRAEAELASRGLHVEPHAGAAITDGLIDACESCRKKWMARRAADSRAAARRAGVRYNGPPWAGVPKLSQFLHALRQSRRLPDGSINFALALFVVREASTADAPTGVATTPSAGGHGAVTGYVVTERVGRTVVAVDGVHDYSVEDPRADPSALLLHVAAQWWGEALPKAPPRWLNDGPVPTPGLLKYKHDICRGKLLYLLCFGPEQRGGRSGGAAATPQLQRLQDLHDSERASRRFAMLLASYRRRRKVHVGAEAIKRAAGRIYEADCVS